MTAAKAVKPKPTAPPPKNGALKWISRSFWIVLYVLSLAASLDAFYDKNTFVVVAPAAITGWFGMKLAERLKNGRP